MTSADPGAALSLIVCGAGPAPNVGVLIDLAQTAGWTVQVTRQPQPYP